MLHSDWTSHQENHVDTVKCHKKASRNIFIFKPLLAVRLLLYKFLSACEWNICIHFLVSVISVEHITVTQIISSRHRRAFKSGAMRLARSVCLTVALFRFVFAFETCSHDVDKAALVQWEICLLCMSQHMLMREKSYDKTWSHKWMVEVCVAWGGHFASRKKIKEWIKRLERVYCFYKCLRKMYSGILTKMDQYFFGKCNLM